MKRNRPESEFYDLKLPWVMKVRADGHMSSVVYIYVSNGRIVGYSELACWEVSKRSCLVCNLLGI